MAPAPITNSYLADLIRQGQSNTDKRFEDLREDFEEKHKENRDSRHKLTDQLGSLRNELHLVEGRVTSLEKDMRTVVGDNTGGSGLLHEIDKKVDTLQSDFAGIKKVLVFLAVVIPLVLAAIGIVITIYKH